ncbi:LLM class flavin-dependent oxidoreductase [Actinocorallia populi]|uniref:LLM class flavin-dependent oxidoreductase n=1 Tax=Actinocorallia populi TaxID=2079200 RepID=UPI000D08876C|nr:LLM class flavin-dependent oxidoreductase [Actinocorallia populi]
MRFALFLPSGQWPGQSPGEALARTVGLARLAEECGFDDVWLAEHHFMGYGVCPSPVVLAGHLLGATTRIGVGTAVAVLSARHPVALAEEAALLASVAPGRFRLGVGRGGPWRELEVFGTGLERWERGFPESLELLLSWLHAAPGSRVGADGEFFRFREVPVVPVPEAPPEVYVACTSPQTEALAASHGLPMLLGMHAGDEEKAEAVARYRAAGGPEEVRHVSTGVAWVADSRREARETVRTELPRWLGPGLAGYVPVDGRIRPVTDVAAYARKLCGLHAVGTVEDCVEALARACAVPGIGQVSLLVECSQDAGRVAENVRRLGSEVLPRLRAELSSRAGAATG